MAVVPILAKQITISFNGDVIARSADYSLEINKETIEITTLDSQGWKEFLVDLKEWSVTVNGLVTRGLEAGKTVYDDLLQNIINSDVVVPIVMVDTGDGGTINLSGNVYLTGLSKSGTVGDSVKWAGKMQGTGALIPA